MKKIVLALLIMLAIPPIHSNECLKTAVWEMNDYYRTPDGCEDGVYNAVSSSMLGWGIGMFAGIMILTGLIYNSKGTTTTTTSTTDTN